MPTLPPKLKHPSFQWTKILLHEPFSPVSFCKDTSCFLWPLLNLLYEGFSRHLPLSTVWVNWALRNTGLNCAGQLIPGTCNAIAPSYSWVSHLQIQHTADWKQYLRIPNSSFPTASKILFWGPWWVESTDSKLTVVKFLGESKVICGFSTVQGSASLTPVMFKVQLYLY